MALSAVLSMSILMMDICTFRQSSGFGSSFSSGGILFGMMLICSSVSRVWVVCSPVLVSVPNCTLVASMSPGCDISVNPFANFRAVRGDFSWRFTMACTIFSMVSLCSGYRLLRVSVISIVESFTVISPCGAVWDSAASSAVLYWLNRSTLKRVSPVRQIVRSFL